jgi:hypothetical protein
MPAPLLLPHDSPLYRRLATFVKTQRLVFFAGLPGTGKSLWIHQLTHLAEASGRQVHLLQWDVARPVFEAHPAAQQYPMVAGVTHGVIRMAVGRWARQALVEWQQRQAEPQAMLIGETPFIGHRLIELARVSADAAETLLRQPACVFVLPVPTPQVRAHIEAERQRRALSPIHAQEREDAPPHVLQALWHEVACLAPRLGVPSCQTSAQAPYDPMVYQGVYLALLKHRHTEVLWCETLLPTTTFSAYDYASPPRYIIPSATAVQRFLQDVERDYADAQALQRDIARWYVV